MLIEAFHWLLEVDYLPPKKTNRIDYPLNVLLKINCDKIFDQLTKVEKGKYFHRVVEINKETKQQYPCSHWSLRRMTSSF